MEKQCKCCGKPASCLNLCKRCYAKFNYHRKKGMSKKSFLIKFSTDSESMYERPIKMSIRDIIIKEAKRFCSDKDDILILESSKKLAIKCIIKNNLAFKKCMMPNTVEEIKISEKEKKLGFEFLPNTELQSLLNSDKKYSFIWADYCGTFCTNKQDIEKMFMLDSMRNNSLLVTTFHKPRTYEPNTKKSLTKFQYVIEAISEIQHSAEKHGWIARVLPIGGCYGTTSNMYSLSFECYKSC